jgi:competence protein ComEC
MGPPLVLLKRPCLLVATFLLPGIVVGHYLFPPGQTAALLLPLAGFLAAALWLLVAHSAFSTAPTMLAVFWVGVVLGVKCGLLPPRHVHFQLEPDRTYRLRGVVAGEPVPVASRRWQKEPGEKRVALTLEAKEVCAREGEANGWRPVRGKVRAYASGPQASQLQYGDKVELTGETFLAEPRRNPGGFDFREYLAQDGIYRCMRASAIRSLGNGHANPVYQLLHSLRRKVRRSFSASGMDPDKESFLHAIILGERREVDEELKEALRSTNTMHILAISGLHVGILAGAIYFFLSRLLFVPQSISSFLAIVVLLAYALLTGMRPPVMRAFLMCTAFLLAPLFKRRSDSINSLAFAAIVILFIRPGELFTVGFQLSFMVVLLILLLSDKFWNWLAPHLRLRPDPGFLTIGRFRRGVYRLLDRNPLRLFSMSLAAFLGFLPLGLYYFNRIFLLSAFCNVLTLFLVGFIVPLGFLAGVVGLLAQGAAGLINSLNGVAIGALQSVVTSFPGVRTLSFNVSPPSPAFCFAFYALLLLLGFSWSLRKLIILKILMAVVTAGLFLVGELARRHPRSVEITFLDVGQGDCIFVEFPDGRKMLVDGGSADRDDVGRYVIVPFLRWAGVNKLHAVLISHFNADHINGLRNVLGEVRTGMVLTRAGPEPPDTSTTLDLLRAIRDRRSICQQAVQVGEKLSLSPQVTAEILNPPPLAESSRLSENNLSIVLKLRFGGSSVLFCGDIEKRAERHVLRQPVSLRSQVLKVPHHGSSSSSSDEFLRHVAPRIGIISCGRWNIYGHPSPEVLERYDRLGVRLFRTDRDGGIVVRVFQDRLTVTTTL